MMWTALLLAFSLSFAAAQANFQGEQGAPLNLANALERAPELDAGVITARAELAAAERELQRTEADPLVLRLARLEAEQRVVNARADLQTARLEAQQRAAARFFDALEANDALELAQAQLDIAETNVRAAQIRFEAGQIGAQERTRAQNERAAAAREVARAEQGRALAYGELASILAVGPEVQLIVPFAPPPVPALDDLLDRLDENAALRRATQAVETAQLSLDLLDARYTPGRDIAAAEDALANAQTQRRELERSLELSVRGLQSAALTARNAYEGAQSALQSAEDELAAQRLRFEAGDVSRLALAEAERSVVERRAALSSARYALTEAVTQLELAVRGAVGEAVGDGEAE